MSLKYYAYYLNRIFTKLVILSVLFFCYFTCYFLINVQQSSIERFNQGAKNIQAIDKVIKEMRPKSTKNISYEDVIKEFQLDLKESPPSFGEYVNQYIESIDDPWIIPNILFGNSSNTWKFFKATFALASIVRAIDFVYYFFHVICIFTTRIAGRKK